MGAYLVVTVCLTTYTTLGNYGKEIGEEGDPSIPLSMDVHCAAAMYVEGYSLMTGRTDIKNCQSVNQSIMGGRVLLYPVMSCPVKPSPHEKTEPKQSVKTKHKKLSSGKIQFT